MPINAEYRGPGELPEIIPVFPLPGALLLPRGQMPLNIFEQRYLAMVQETVTDTEIAVTRSWDRQASASEQGSRRRAKATRRCCRTSAR